MNFTLMQKDHKVLELDIAKDGAKIDKIGEIYNAARIPVGTLMTDSGSICETLNH